jgi:hypothetical protein
MIGGCSVFSPKGWDSIAQGNALGRSIRSLQPEGLRQESLRLSHPFRVQKTTNRTQGVALGYAVPGFQPEERKRSTTESFQQSKQC